MRRHESHNCPCTQYCIGSVKPQNEAFRAKSHAVHENPSITLCNVRRRFNNICLSRGSKFNFFITTGDYRLPGRPQQLLHNLRICASITLSGEQKFLHVLSLSYPPVCVCVCVCISAGLSSVNYPSASVQIYHGGNYLREDLLKIAVRSFVPLTRLLYADNTVCL